MMVPVRTPKRCLRYDSTSTVFFNIKSIIIIMPDIVLTQSWRKVM